MKRDLLNHEGIKIGELELPDDTPEEIWQKQLSMYNISEESQKIPDITPKQLRQAIVLSGIPLSTIEAIVDSLDEPMRSLTKIQWEYSILFERDNDLVNKLGHTIGLDSKALDDLWILAGTL